MNNPEPSPTPPELAHAPECAALSILEYALYATGFALLAAQPAVADAELDDHLDRQELLADVILKQVDVLQLALRRYRHAAMSSMHYARVDHDPF